MSPYRASWQAKGILLPKPKAGSTSPLGQLDPEPAPRQSQASVSRLSPSLWPYGQYGDIAAGSGYNLGNLPPKHLKHLQAILHHGEQIMTVKPNCPSFPGSVGHAHWAETQEGSSNLGENPSE